MESASPGSAPAQRPDSGRIARSNGKTTEQYLIGLTKVLRQSPSERLIVMGDFNQKIGPDSRAPRPLQSALQKAFSPTMTNATADLAFQERKSIDHIAASRDWTVESLDVISNIHQERELSDHFGVAADLSFRHSLIATIPIHIPLSPHPTYSVLPPFPPSIKLECGTLFFSFPPPLSALRERGIKGERVPIFKTTSAASTADR